ncbi:hypothetical protein HYW46_03595 [Candidatus Daviesbacteria bacterium]|nr:hypothetical protein [Candidatus Daviesbacteria bacterium]
MNEQIRELNDIPLPHNQIDPKIQSLVRGLISVGVVTLSSCEGHLDGVRIPFPNVGLQNDGVFYENLLMGTVQPIINRFNETSRVRWEIGDEYAWFRGYAFYRDLNPVNDTHEDLKSFTQKKLRILQNSAIALGKFLFVNRTPGLEKNMLRLGEPVDISRLIEPS